MHLQLVPCVGQVVFWQTKSGSGTKLDGIETHRSPLQFKENQKILNILCRDWSRRTWIIQEVASARKATVLYGEKSISWELFAEISRKLGEGILSIDQHRGMGPQRSLDNIAAIETARRSNSGPLSMSLFHILVATSFSRCTDPRDKVFAVAGLAKDWVLGKTFDFDYDKSKDEVYEDFAIADINRTKDLRIFSCPSHTPSLPSWVPDWSEIQNPDPFVLYTDRTKFSTSGGIKAVAWHSTDQRVLHVTGKSLDGIEVIGPVPRFTKVVAVFEINEAQLNDVKQSYGWLRDCQELASDENGEMIEERREMFWRTMLCGLTGDAFPVHNKYSQYFDQYMDFMKNAESTFRQYFAEAKTRSTEIPGRHELLTHYRAFSLVEASISKWSTKRRICTTINGRLASVSNGSQKGDVICTLLGVEVSYVLRSVPGGFSVM